MAGIGFPQQQQQQQFASPFSDGSSGNNSHPQLENLRLTEADEWMESTPRDLIISSLSTSQRRDSLGNNSNYERCPPPPPPSASSVTGHIIRITSGEINNHDGMMDNDNEEANRKLSADYFVHPRQHHHHQHQHQHNSQKEADIIINNSSFSNFLDSGNNNNNNNEPPFPAPQKRAPPSPQKKRRPRDEEYATGSGLFDTAERKQRCPCGNWIDGAAFANFLDSCNGGMGSQPCSPARRGSIGGSSFSPSHHNNTNCSLNLDDSRLSQNTTLLTSPARPSLNHNITFTNGNNVSNSSFPPSHLSPSSAKRPTNLSSVITSGGSPLKSSGGTPETPRKSPIAPVRLFADEDDDEGNQNHMSVSISGSNIQPGRASTGSGSGGGAAAAASGSSASSASSVSMDTAMVFSDDTERGHQLFGSGEIASAASLDAMFASSSSPSSSNNFGGSSSSSNINNSFNNSSNNNSSFLSSSSVTTTTAATTSASTVAAAPGMGQRYALLRRHSDGIPSTNVFSMSPADGPCVQDNMVHRSCGRLQTEFVMDKKDIGCGSYGRVHKVIRRLDMCAYAVKVVENRRSWKLPLREVHALASQADNPFVVRYFDSWVEDDSLYILTELCRESLADRRNTPNQCSEQEIFQIATHILMGLSGIHDNNMAHLDIKPENIYLSRTGVYKIGDLGTACIAVGEASIREAEDGDNRYLCRELMRGSLHDLRQADLFSLGATLLELATWKPLPQSNEEYDALRDGTFVVPDTMSRDLEEMIRLMMHPNPEMRPTCAALLNHPLLAPHTALVDMRRLCASFMSSSNESWEQSMREEREERIRLQIEVNQLRHMHKADEAVVERLRAEVASMRSQMEAMNAYKNRRVDDAGNSNNNLPFPAPTNLF